MFTYKEFISVAHMKLKADGVIGLMGLCDEHGITAELRYDNTKEESMTGTMMKIIMRNFYIIGRSSETYNQHKNKCEGQIWDLKYRSKQLMIKTNTPSPLWDFYIVTEYEIILGCLEG